VFTDHNIKIVGRKWKKEKKCLAIFWLLIRLTKIIDVNCGFSQDGRVKFLNSFNQSHIFVYNGNPRKKISSMNHASGNYGLSRSS